MDPTAINTIPIVNMHHVITDLNCSGFFIDPAIGRIKQIPSNANIAVPISNGKDSRLIQSKSLATPLEEI